MYFMTFQQTSIARSYFRLEQRHEPRLRGCLLVFLSRRWWFRLRSLQGTSYWRIHLLLSRKKKKKKVHIMSCKFMLFTEAPECVKELPAVKGNEETVKRGENWEPEQNQQNRNVKRDWSPQEHPDHHEQKSEEAESRRASSFQSPSLWETLLSSHCSCCKWAGLNPQWEVLDMVCSEVVVQVYVEYYE